MSGFLDVLNSGAIVAIHETEFVVTATHDMLIAWRKVGSGYEIIKKRAGGAALFSCALDLRNSATNWLRHLMLGLP